MVFDFSTIQDHATIQEPDLYADGIDYVIVNGELTVDGGTRTGALPGIVIHRNLESGSAP